MFKISTANVIRRFRSRLFRLGGALVAVASLAMVAFPLNPKPAAAQNWPLRAAPWQFSTPQLPAWAGSSHVRQIHAAQIHAAQRIAATQRGAAGFGRQYLGNAWFGHPAAQVQRGLTAPYLGAPATAVIDPAHGHHGCHVPPRPYHVPELGFRGIAIPGQGVRVLWVRPGCVAASHGIAPGDVIHSIDGHHVCQPAEVQFALGHVSHCRATLLVRDVRTGCLQQQVVILR